MKYNYFLMEDPFKQDINVEETQKTKIKKFLCNMRLEMQKKCAKVSLRHKMFALE